MILFLFISSLLAWGSSMENSYKNSVALHPILTDKGAVHIVQDLDANRKPYHYYSLQDNRSVSDEKSDSKEWDIAFSKTTILFNTAANVKAQMVNTPFDKIMVAPKSGYITDSETAKALPAGSGNSWYIYDMQFHAITPIREKTILLQLSTNRFAKIDIISYYKGAPEDIPTEESSFYTFRYVISDENGQF